MAGHKTSETRKAKYKSQPMRTEANRQRKLKKHIKKQPNDKQAATKISTL